MTTYILHGGEIAKKSETNNNFFAEFTQNVDSKNISVLLCYWAREKSEWDELVARDVEKIKKFSGNKSVTILIAEDAKDLEEKMDKSQVLYIAGGTYAKLKKEFAKVENVKELFNGKVIIGSSAGAFLLARHSLNSFDEQPTEINVGLRLIPISVLCHWDIEDEKEKKLNKEFQFAPDDPILTLNEGEYATFYMK